MNEQFLLDQVVKEFSLEPIVLSSSNRFRWVLHDREGLGHQMIKIERRLQEMTGRPIDLRLLLKKDKNRRSDRNYLRGVEKL